MENSILFSGFNWQVKQSYTKVGPGPNLFSDEGISLLENELKLEVIQRDGNIYCSEIFLDKTLGYGRLMFAFMISALLHHDSGRHTPGRS